MEGIKLHGVELLANLEQPPSLGRVQHAAHWSTAIDDHMIAVVDPQ
jgi:hypothetical protein